MYRTAGHPHGGNPLASHLMRIALAAADALDAVLCGGLTLLPHQKIEVKVWMPHLFCFMY